MSSALLPTPLVSVAWLAEHLGAPWLRVVDATMYLPSAARDARAEYTAAHIAGAVFCDIGYVSDDAALYPHTLPSAELFAARVGALGIGSEHAVVVYDSSGQNFSGPRLWWLLRTFGHTQVAILDGGLRAWTAAGHAVTSDVSAVTPAHFTAALAPARVRDIDAMRANVASHAEQVVDARSPGRFQAIEAEPRAGVRGGHIPDSVNVHYAKLVREDGTMRTADELRRIMADAQLDLTRPIVASCGSGVTACAVVLALDVLGVSNTAVYDGSWTEWGSAPDTPVATGP